MPVQHAEILFVFVVVVFMTAFLVALFLFGRLVRLIVCRRVIQCGPQTFAEVFEVTQCSGYWLNILNLYLPLPLDRIPNFSKSSILLSDSLVAFPPTMTGRNSLR